MKSMDGDGGGDKDLSQAMQASEAQASGDKLDLDDEEAQMRKVMELSRQETLNKKSYEDEEEEMMKKAMEASA